MLLVRAQLDHQTLSPWLFATNNSCHIALTLEPCTTPTSPPFERLVIRELTANDQIIIKRADKGSAVVIWDRLDYFREGYRQLSDSHLYKKLDHNPMQSFARRVSNMVEDMFQNEEIDQSVTDILFEPVCRPPELDLLPNIHNTVPLKAGQLFLPTIDLLNASHNSLISF